MQFSTTVRNARLDAIESTTGASAILTIRSGAAPATLRHRQLRHGAGNAQPACGLDGGGLGRRQGQVGNLV
jgi:hypothetical protein